MYYSMATVRVGSVSQEPNLMQVRFGYSNVSVPFRPVRFHKNLTFSRYGSVPTTVRFHFGRCGATRT